MNRSSHYSIVLVVLIYALCAALWILLSDRIVLWLFEERSVMMLISSIKGWLFVFVTSCLLYGLLRHRQGIYRDIGELKKAQQIIRDSEARFRALVEQSLAGIFIIQNGRLCYVNPAFAAMLGFDNPEQIIDKIEVSSLIKPECSADVEQTIMRLTTRKMARVSNFGFTAIRRDGQPVFLEAHGSAFEYRGRPAVIGLMLDVSARKTAEDSLRASMQRFQDIVSISADWIWEVDPAGQYIYASDGVFDILGYSAEEILGKTPFDLMPESESERQRKWFDAIVEQRESFRDIENINRHKDGSLRYIVTNGTPIIDDAGRLLGYRGLDRDVTEHKQAERALHDSEAFKRAILDSVNAHIAVLDNQGTIIAINRPWLRFAEENGLNRDDSISGVDVGVNYLEVCRRSNGFSSEGARDAAEGILAVLEGQSAVFNLEYACHSPDRKRWFMMTVTPLTIDDKGVVVAHTDITLRKEVEETLRRQTEELSQRNRELERFNQVTIGRELDMIALKKQVNALSEQLGLDPPYSLSFLDDKAP